MKYKTMLSALALMSFAAAACALREPTIKLSADDSDLRPLVGKWTGGYSSSETGRSGDISFTLKDEHSEASGGIVMTVRAPVTNIVPPAQQMVQGVIEGADRQLLTIHFARKEGNAVLGLLDPYVDPACQCRVTTTFQGVFVDWRTIEGTYRTQSADLVYTPTRGIWKVTLLKR